MTLFCLFVVLYPITFVVNIIVNISSIPMLNGYDIKS